MVQMRRTADLGVPGLRDTSLNTASASEAQRKLQKRGEEDCNGQNNNKYAVNQSLLNGRIKKTWTNDNISTYAIMGWGKISMDYTPRKLTIGNWWLIREKKISGPKDEPLIGYPVQSGQPFWWLCLVVISLHLELSITQEAGNFVVRIFPPPDWIIWGRENYPDPDILTIENLPKILAKALVAASIKDMEEGSLFSWPACSYSYWKVHFFMGITVYFFGNPAFNEDQLRHPGSWTEETAW